MGGNAVVMVVMHTRKAREMWKNKTEGSGMIYRNRAAFLPKLPTSSKLLCEREMNMYFV